MTEFVEIQQRIDEQPRRRLPPEIAPALRPSSPDVALEMLQAVITTVPAYSRPLEGDFGESIRAGVRQALDHFLAEMAGGEGEKRAGRSLDSLLSAYRIGARVAWRRFSEVGTEAGFDSETLFELAE